MFETWQQSLASGSHDHFLWEYEQPMDYDTLVLPWHVSLIFAPETGLKTSCQCWHLWSRWSFEERDSLSCNGCWITGAVEHGKLGCVQRHCMQSETSFRMILFQISLFRKHPSTAKSQRSPEKEKANRRWKKRPGDFALSVRISCWVEADLVYAFSLKNNILRKLNYQSYCRAAIPSTFCRTKA